MFKQANLEDELYHSMETTLVKSQVEQEHGLDKLAKATDLLNTAATIFEHAGMYSEAEQIVEVIVSLAGLDSQKKSFDPTVGRIQDALNKYLYTDGQNQPIVRDGLWGPSTQAAMQKFMKSKNINSVQEAIKLLFQQSPLKENKKNPLLVNPWESK